MTYLEWASDTLIPNENGKEAMATLEIGIPACSSVVPVMAVRWSPTRHEQGLTILGLLIFTTREVRYD